MIDVQREQPISFNEASRFLPDNRRPGFSTWWRWSTHGIRGVKLETIMVGGRRCTTAEAVRRFFERVTAVADGIEAPSRTPHEHEAAIASAEARWRTSGRLRTLSSVPYKNVRGAAGACRRLATFWIRGSSPRRSTQKKTPGGRSAGAPARG